MAELRPDWADLDTSASFFRRPKGVVLGVDGSQNICLVTSDYWAAKMNANGFSNVKTAWVETISPYRYSDGKEFKIGHKVAIGQKDGKTYVLDLPQTEFIEMGEGSWERTHSVMNNATHPEYDRLLGEIPMSEIAKFMDDPQDMPNEYEVMDFLRAKGENMIVTDQETGKALPAGALQEQGRYYDYEGTYKGFNFKIDDGETIRVKTQSSLRTTQDILRPRLVEVDPKKNLTSQYNKKVVAPKTPSVATAVETSNPTTLPGEPVIKTAPAGDPVTSNTTPAAVAPSAPRAAPDIKKGMNGEDAFYYHYTEAGNGDQIAGGSIKPDADGRIYFFEALERVNEQIFEEISTRRALEGKETSTDFDVYEPKPDIASPDSSAMYVEPKAEIRISDPYVMYSGQYEFAKPTPPPEIPQKISATATPNTIEVGPAPIQAMDVDQAYENKVSAMAGEPAIPRPRSSGIEFIESDSTNYEVRTRINASQSDFTIAYAANHNSWGEQATQREVANAKREIYKFGVTFGNDVERANRLATLVERYNGQEVEINIAGNGEYQKGMPSTQLLTEEIAKDLAFLQKKGVGIIAIRSGGQTGADEAGVKAAVQLGIPAKVVAPKTWKFRTGSAGGAKTDRTGKEAFLARFEGIATTMGTLAPTPVAPAATPAPSAPPSGNSRLNAGAIPNNIYSNAGKNVNGMSRFERSLRAALTNPTNDIVNFVDTASGREFPQDSYGQKTIEAKYPVVYEGKVFPSSEHAFFYYQNELNLSESPKDSPEQAATKLKRAEEIMGKIVAEKLRQHPRLVVAIDKLAAQEGITGEEWIAKQSHYTGKAEGRKPSHWTGDGLGSGFLRALSQAYSLAKQQPRSLPVKTDTASVLEHEMLVKWSQSDENWKYFPTIDRFGKFRSKQSYYVSGTVNAAVEVAASFQTKAAMADTAEQKASYEAQAKRVLDESKVDSGILRAWERLSELAVGKVSDSSARTRLSRPVGATSAFGTYYDSPVQDKIAQLDPSVKGKTIPNVIADIASENGVDLSAGKTRSFGVPTADSTDTMGTKEGIEETMRKFVIALRAVTDAKRKFKQVGISPDSRLGKGGTISEKNARDLSLVIMKLSSLLKDYADPALAIESQKMQRFGGEGRRGTLSPGAELASKLVGRGENLSADRIEQISKFSRRQAEAYARAMGIEMGNFGEESKAFNRPIVDEVDHSLPEQRFIDAVTDSDGALGRKFQAAVEESYSFRLSPDGKITPKESTKKSAKIAKAIATTMEMFPALAERVVPTPSGFTRSARGTNKPIFQLNSGYSPNFSSSLGEVPNEKLVGPVDNRVSDAVSRESAATRAFASGEYNDKVVLVRLGNVLKSGLKVGAAQTDLFDELTKNYLTGNFASDLKALEAKEKLVGPIAKLAGTGKKDVNPIEVAAQYRQNPEEKLIQKLNTIEIAVDFETARKMGIVGPQGRSLPNLFAETVTGIISPQTYVSSNVRVLPGGAVISTDPSFIEAYGFPKVLPYVVEPTGDPKKPFRLKPVEVPERGVETTTSGYVPTKSGGDKAKNIDYRREQLLREARGSKIFDDISFKAEQTQGGLPKGRETNFDIDRRARLDFIISQIDILAETPSAWTSKEVFDQSMIALKGSMTESDFKSMTSSSAGGADDITGVGRSSRWNLSKNFQRLVALWDSPERDIMFADASKRWTAISGLEQYTNFVQDGEGVRAVIPTVTETERMAGTDFSGPSEVAKKAEKYLPVELVEIRDNDGKAKFVSAASEEARKYYLENGEVVSKGRPNETKSRNTLVSRSTDVTAKYPTIFPGDKSQAIEDLIVSVDEISRLSYRFAYALGYGSDMKPLGSNESTPDVRTMQAIASTVSSLIDEEHFTFARIFNVPTSLSQTGYEQPIVPDFRRQAEVHLRVLETLERQAKFREVIDTETGVVLREKPANVPEPAEVKSFSRSQLEARISQIEEAAGSAKNATELALLKRQYQALLDGERIPNYENIIRDASTVTVKDDSSPDVTAKLGKGIQGNPLEEIASRLAATMLGDEDPSVLRNVLGKNKLLDLFNEGPEAATAAIIKRAWAIFGENATPDLMRELSFNYNGREYLGTMGVGTDGRPIMAVQPQRTTETFLPAENPLQAEPSVRQDTTARKALIVEAEKNVQAGKTETALINRQTSDTRDYLRAEDNSRTVVIRKKSQWNGEVSAAILQLFSEMDKGKLDATVRVFVDDLLAEYVKPDGTRVTYDDVIQKLDYGDLVKSGPYNIAHRLFDHGINGEFKDIEAFVRYSQDVRDQTDTVEIGGRYARDLGIDPETGRMIVGGADATDGEIDARPQGELNTERRDIAAELRTGPLGDGGFNPEVGSADHNAMMAYEQGKMYGGLGLPWTKALSDLGRPLREAPGSMKAFHGRGGFGAGFAADAAYMAWKGYLDPTTLAVSAGFNSINFLPMKYAPKVGLIGAAANLGLTAVTGGDMGRAAMMTIGGILGGAVGAFGGGFGAIGGSFAGSEIGDYIWSDVFGNKNNQQNKYGPRVPTNPTNAIKITPRIGP
jgi:hypothetical protein